MPGYAEADLIQARKPIKDQAGRDLAFCNLGHLETEQREAATSDRAEMIRALQVNIATFDGVEPETEASQTDPDPVPEPTAGSQPPPSAPLPTPATPTFPSASTASDARALSRASMLRTLARAGITPVGGQQAPVGTSGGDTSLGASMRRTLARMGVQPTREA